MAVELTMPQMDQTMTTGKVGKWLVKEGDVVKQGDPVLEIETDKVVHELESPSNGNIAQLLVEEGRKVPVNAVLAIIAAPGEKVERRSVTRPVEAKAGEPESRKAGKPESQKVITYQSPVTSHQLPVTSYQSPVTSYQSPVTSYQSPVPTSVKASPAARSLAQQHNVDLTQVKGSGPVGRIVESDVQAYIDSLSPEPAVSERLKASPLARRLAKEHGLDLTVIAGSGPGGRIVRDDVFKAAEAAVAVPAEPIPAVQPEVAPVQVIPMTGIRQIIAERMTLSAQTTACVTLNTEVDVTELVELRTWLNQKLSAKEISLTYTDLLVKIIAHALRQHPRLNSTLADDGIHLIEQINIGVAVALEDGLVVPVVTNADQKGVAVISREIKALAEKARNNQLRPGDLRGGTFTLTNLGMFGIDTFTPIINPPECAILGVGRIVKKPAVHKDEITIRSMMGLSLSFDHRIVDGAPAAQFLQTVTEYITEPYLLLV